MVRQEEIIGGARLICGDCRDLLSVLGRIDSVVTDPPYGMDFQSNFRTDKHTKIASDDDAYALRWACRLFADHSKYVFCRWNNLWQLPKQPKSLITWVRKQLVDG